MSNTCFSLFLFLSALAVGGCGGGKIPLQRSDVPQGNTECESHAFSEVVVLSSANARALEPHFSPLWDASTNNVNDATAKIADYLRQLHSDNAMRAQEISQIRARLKKTVCQAVGITFEGQKAVLLNCLPLDSSLIEPWRKTYLKVYDGGSHFWNVIYLPGSDSFVNFEINGWA
jgi:hypothetical protein